MGEKRGGETPVLRAPEPEQTLSKLRLTTGKAAEFCGVSRRQLCYWTDSGLVSTVEAEEGDEVDGASGDGERRLYDFPALQKVLLIKAALDHSPGLRRAVLDTNQHLERKQKQTEELRNAFDQKREAFLSDQAERLEALAASIKQAAPNLSSRKTLVSLCAGLAPLQRLSEAAESGGFALAEDLDGCLDLAAQLDQLEARARGVTES